DAGQLRGKDLYQLAKNCFRCHAVSNERLINNTAHKTGDSQNFEFAAWNLGEVRHNFHTDQTFNANVPTLWATNPDGSRKQDKDPALRNRIRMMYFCGKLAELNVSLRNRALATTNGRYAKAMNTRIKNILRDVGELVEIFAEEKVEVPLLAKAMSAAMKVEDQLTTFDAASREKFLAAASEVERVSIQFERDRDGSKLGLFDEDLGLSELPKEGARGTPYPPN
ncbi:MAG: hypothetical protein N2C14_24095, partial [Planctomycetales bacterium]